MRHAYEHRDPPPEAQDRVRFLRQAFSDLHDIVEGHCPDSRERAVALTQLEQAALWAVKAITHGE